MASFAVFRLNTELEALETLPGTSLHVRPGNDRLASVIEYTMDVREGIYEGRMLRFELRIPHGYPFSPPKLLCMDRVFHPNIDGDGNVCMEILRLRWTPGHGLENIFVNLHVIFLEISGKDALNTVAGDLFEEDPRRFTRVARGLEHL